MPTTNQKPRKLGLTGGGTAGHVMPHLALLPEFDKRGWSYFYIGSDGMEKDLIAPTKMKYYCVSSGKLRRYLSIKNFFDLFKIAFGFVQSLFVLLRERPDVVFSKGGFVSVPVCYAACLLRIPVITHESDLTPGLATKLITKIARLILYSFTETARYLPAARARFVGAILRQEIFTGKKDEGLRVAGFSANDPRPVLLVMGGSLGAQKLNDALAQALPELLKEFRVIHLTGKGKNAGLAGDGYRSFEFLSAELKHVFACTDFILARAGANSIFEFLALRKPMLLVPLEAGSRGDQVHNTQSFVKHGWAKELREKNITTGSLIASLQDLKANASTMRAAQDLNAPPSDLSAVLSVLA